MSLPVAEAILAGLYLFDIYDRQVEARNQRKYRPFPIPPAHRRRFDPVDVSLVVPTVDTDPAVFDACLTSWLRCGPGEIIVVTTEAQVVRVAVILFGLSSSLENGDVVSTTIKLLAIEKPNKRHQLIRGIQESRGKILALVDDDARWESAETLTSLLAPFEEDDIGLVGGPVDSYLPPERRDPTVVTPWEVAALRLRANRHARMKAAHAADGGINFCVSGVTMLARARLLRDDPLFQFEFANEHWGGRRQNAGDDAFLTRWVLFHHLADDLPARRRRMVEQLRKDAAATGGTFLGDRYEDEAVFEQLLDVTELDTRRWRLGVQMTEQATVPTYLKRGAEFAGQMKRWTRSGLRLRLTCLLFEPGIIKMYRTAPYMTRKMVECTLAPLLHWLYIGSLLVCLAKAPALGFMILFYEIYNWASSLFAFVRQFPFAAPYWWAAALVDRVQLLSDLYCWATLGTEAWETRNTDGDQDGDPLLLMEEVVRDGRDT